MSDPVLAGYPAFDPDVVAPVLVRELDRATETGWLVWRDKRYAVTPVAKPTLQSVRAENDSLRAGGSPDYEHPAMTRFRERGFRRDITVTGFRTDIPATDTADGATYSLHYESIGVPTDDLHTCSASCPCHSGETVRGD